MLHEWERQLLYDLAMSSTGSGEPIMEILRKHSITKEWLERRMADVNFYRAYQSMKDKLEAGGEPFKIKARLLAEMWLDQMDRLLANPEASATAKVELFKHITGLAGYSAKPPERSEGGERVVINLNFGGQNNRTIDVTPALPSTSDRNQE